MPEPFHQATGGPLIAVVDDVAARVRVTPDGVPEVSGVDGGQRGTSPAASPARSLAGESPVALAGGSPVALAGGSPVALAGGSPVALACWDPGGRVLAWTEAAERMFGWPRAEVLGRACPMLAGAGGQSGAELRELSLAGERVQDHELEVRRADGTVASVLVSTAPVIRDGVVVCVVAGALETAGRRFDERASRRPGGDGWSGRAPRAPGRIEDILSADRRGGALREAESRLQAIFDHVPAGLSLRGLDGRYLQVNNYVARALGTTPEALVGRNPGEHLDPEVFARVRADDREMLRSREPIVQDVTVRHADETDHDYHVVSYPILDEHRQVSAFGSFTLDITARKQTQRELEHQRAQLAQLLAAHRALGEIATLVATSAHPEEVFRAVASELADLFEGTLGGIVRFDPVSGTGVIVGGWSGADSTITGERIKLTGPSAAAQVYRTARPVRIERYVNRAAEPVLERFDIRDAICAPVHVGGELWGSAGVAFASSTTVPADAQARLPRFTELVAVAIGNAQARETLMRQATTDPVTGLANHRAFHERLHAELERSSRYARPLSIALFDLDHFKQVNDTYGHRTGDEVLAAVASRLAALPRTGELIARIGGEEFAWLMPETTQDGAYQAAERARHAIEAAPFDRVGALTISAGVCSNQHNATPDGLVNAADRALYRAKHSGRNRTSTHAP